ncbi:hypothetical protein GCM10027175_33270 [Hymenobacter latericoloratus]
MVYAGPATSPSASRYTSSQRGQRSVGRKDAGEGIGAIQSTKQRKFRLGKPGKIKQSGSIAAPKAAAAD